MENKKFSLDNCPPAAAPLIASLTHLMPTNMFTPNLTESVVKVGTLMRYTLSGQRVKKRKTGSGFKNVWVTDNLNRVPKKLSQDQFLFSSCLLLRAVECNTKYLHALKPTSVCCNKNRKHLNVFRAGEASHSWFTSQLQVYRHWFSGPVLD